VTVARTTSAVPLTIVFFVIAASMGCERQTAAPPDHPRLTPNVRMQDVTFHSVSLDRDMPYRVVLPVNIPGNKKLPVLYLLHGGGGGYRDWSNYSNVAQFAERGLILVMPEGNSSYYVNAAERPEDRYEDYVTRDLVADVENKFPAATGRANRAIAGISMGGFGAIVLSLKHPELFAFAGGLSSAIDVPSRPFSIKRVGQYRQHRAIFGPWGSQIRHDNDPYILARSVDSVATPYLFLACGEQEGLLPANKRFAAILKTRDFHYEFQSGPGGHDWNQWDRRLPDLFQSLRIHSGANY
jgi:putative tributyrin esterase